MSQHVHLPSSGCILPILVFLDNSKLLGDPFLINAQKCEHFCRLRAEPEAPAGHNVSLYAKRSLRFSAGGLHRQKEACHLLEIGQLVLKLPPLEDGHPGITCQAAQNHNFVCCGLLSRGDVAGVFLVVRVLCLHWIRCTPPCPRQPLLLRCR